MENPSPAEELPATYRAILDGVAELERLGQRREAALVRAEAIKAYSAAWDDRGRRRLVALLRRTLRVIDETEPPGEDGGSFRGARRGALPAG